MEQSESGAPIYRHKTRERGFEVAFGDSENMEAISQHIERYIGPVATVFHELLSDLVHIDVHIVKPTPERNWYTLVTSGMSDRAMHPPEEYADLGYSELMLSLPPHWPMSDEAWKQEENYWPVRLLKHLARFPHEYETWLWLLHTIPNGNPSAPFAPNTAMTGVILLPPLRMDAGFQELKISEEKTIHFHALVPLHEDEMDFKLRHGAEALFTGFEKHQVTELLDPARPSVVSGPQGGKKAGWLGRLFGRK